MKKDTDEYILESDTRLITLNTRITQHAYDKLYEIQGFLQAERSPFKVTKQQATVWAICEAHRLLMRSFDEPDKPNYSEPDKMPQKPSEELDHAEEGGPIMKIFKKRKEAKKKKKLLADKMHRIMAREKVDRHHRKPWSLDHEGR